MLFSNLTNTRFLTCAVGLVSIFLATEAYAERTLRLISLTVRATTDSGEDEVYIMVDGKRYPASGSKAMNEDSYLSNWMINVEIPLKNTTNVSVFEDDPSNDDKIGQLSGNENLFAGPSGQLRVLTLANAGIYELAYEVLENPTDFNNGFTLAVTSDPQIGWCGGYCKHMGMNSPYANILQSLSLGKLKNNTDKPFMGVIVNGDITHTMEDEQLTMYRELYENKFVTYLGLGNHDYEEYTPTRNDSKHACGLGHHLCLQAMVDYIVEATNANPLIEGFDYKLVKDPTTSAEVHTGSLAYYFDIGDYRFVQLQNHPAYELKFGSLEFAIDGLLKFPYDIKQSFEWLEELLKKSDGKTIILNMHEMNTGDGFSANPNLTVYVDPDSDEKKTDQDKTNALKKLYGDGYRRLQKLLGKYDNIGAIFAGHNHSLLGDQHEYKKIGKGENEFWKIQKINSPRVFKTIGTFRKDIPVFYSGSADYNKYLRVDFKPREMTVTVIDSSSPPGPLKEALDENQNPLKETINFPIEIAPKYYLRTDIGKVQMELSYFGATAKTLPKVDGQPQYLAAFTKNTAMSPIHLSGGEYKIWTIIDGRDYELVFSKVSPDDLRGNTPLPTDNGNSAFAIWTPVGSGGSGYAKWNPSESEIYSSEDGSFFYLDAKNIFQDGYGRLTGVWLKHKKKPKKVVDDVSPPPTIQLVKDQ